MDVTHDANGNLVTIHNPHSNPPVGPALPPVTTYTYDPQGRATTVTDAVGGVTNLTYNFAGRLSAATLPGSAAWSFDPISLYGLVDTSTGSGTSSNPATIVDPALAVASWTNPLSGVRQLAVDTLGFDYTWLGRIDTITLPDPDGTGPLPAPVIEYTQDLLGRRTEVTDPSGLVTSSVYDTAGNLASVTLPDPDGSGPRTAAVSTATYDALNRVLTETSPGGITTSYVYDSAGRVTSITGMDPDGAGPQTAPVSTIGYDAIGRRTSITDALGGVTSFVFDAAGNRISVTNALGNSTSATFDAAGQVLTTTDAANATTTFVYDVLGNTTSVTLPDPDGAGALTAPVFTTGYDAFGRAVSSTAPDGGVSTVAFDINGRVSQQTAPDGSFVTFAFDAAGQLVTQTTSDPDGAGPLLPLVTSYGYDSLGRIASVTDPNGGVSSSAYNALGQLASGTDSTGRTTTFAYDGWSRNVSITDALANQSSVTYNASGQVATSTDGLGNTTTIGYDAAGRAISSTDALAGVTAIEFDTLGRRTKLTDAVGNATTWTYDAIGQILTETQSDGAGGGGTRSFVYDSVGRLTQRTDRNGRVIDFGYDQLGRQIEQKWMIGATTVNTIATAYNNNLRVVSVVDDDSSLAFTWDNMGRLLTVNNNGTPNTPNVSLSYQYDTIGRTTQLAATVNSVADFVNQFGYDSAGRVSQVTQTDGDALNGDSITDKRVDLDYDASGRLTSLARYESLDTSVSVADSSWTFDTAGRLTSLQHVVAGSPNPVTIAGYTFTWDASDRITSIDSVRDGITTYSYDATNQLTAADYATQTDETFGYDVNGNRTTSSALPGSSGPAVYTTGDHNRITTDGTYNYAYDLEGNRISKTNIVTLESVEYVWNNANLLTDVITRDSLGAVTKTVSYRYDGLGRRIGKFVDDNGDTVIDRSETFIYDGAGLLSPLPRFGGEGQGEGVTAIRIPGVNGALGQYGWVDNVVLVYSDVDGSGPASSTLTSRNLYRPLVDQIFASEDATGNVLWALTDQLGTPRDWADRDSTTGTTSVALHTRFTAFGAIESVTDGTGSPLSSSILPPSSFTGQLYDADAELYYYRARWYDPVLGKFLSDDPMSFGAGDANVSRYVGNGTATRRDPSGLDGMDIKMDIWIRARNREHRHDPPPPPDLRSGSYIVVENATGLFGEWFEEAAEEAGEKTHVDEGYENKWAELHEMKLSMQTGGPDDVIIFVGHRYTKYFDTGIQPANDWPGGDLNYGPLRKQLSTTYSVFDIVDDLNRTTDDPAIIVFAGCSTDCLAPRIIENTNTKLVIGTTSDISLGDARVLVKTVLRGIQDGLTANQLKTTFDNESQRRRKKRRLYILGQTSESMLNLIE
jgi:RHS repeat-associated protein